jgi:hypothetical protein
MFDHEFSDAAVDVDVALRAPEGLQRCTSGTYVKAYQGGRRSVCPEPDQCTLASNNGGFALSPVMAINRRDSAAYLARQKASNHQTEGRLFMTDFQPAQRPSSSVSLVT